MHATVVRWQAVRPRVARAPGGSPLSATPAASGAPPPPPPPPPLPRTWAALALRRSIKRAVAPAWARRRLRATAGQVRAGIRCAPARPRPPLPPPRRRGVPTVPQQVSARDTPPVSQLYLQSAATRRCRPVPAASPAAVAPTPPPPPPPAPPTTVPRPAAASLCFIIMYARPAALCFRLHPDRPVPAAGSCHAGAPYSRCHVDRAAGRSTGVARRQTQPYRADTDEPRSGSLKSAARPSAGGAPAWSAGGDRCGVSAARQPQRQRLRQPPADNSLTAAAGANDELSIASPPPPRPRNKKKPAAVTWERQFREPPRQSGKHLPLPSPHDALPRSMTAAAAVSMATAAAAAAAAAAAVPSGNKRAAPPRLRLRQLTVSAPVPDRSGETIP
ncbi:formin-like protein 14 [Schistocerca piceifrons]|uniref:formin-like protein 14 n=1 Tax=Schistocerca piceifrons TaxID=274613 RepID=UPI001F5EF8B3|nr:formin-like protein 14 [Schistocerca piceifrons]